MEQLKSIRYKAYTLHNNLFIKLCLRFCSIFQWNAEHEDWIKVSVCTYTCVAMRSVFQVLSSKLNTLLRSVMLLEKLHQETSTTMRYCTLLVSYICTYVHVFMNAKLFITGV